jgi:lipopolysaccharide export system protein LptA
MAAPAGTPITNAEGKRTAEFSGNVTVVRGRLTAKGPSLSYSEVSGAGVLKGGASATYTPEKKDDDVVNINATSMSFDVDTDMSTSEGGVKLVSGAQTGNSSKLVFDEKKELGLLTGNVQMNRAARGKQKALAITGEEARILTTNKLLYVKGKIRLVSGDTTTTGNEMFYDDKKNLAVIVGSAVSTNAKEGTRVTGNVLEQRIDLGRVRQLTGGYKIPTDQFKLSTEK